MRLSAKNLLLLALMAASAALAVVLRPTVNLARERPPINLKVMVPVAFGDWREERNVRNQIVNPQQEQLLNKIYSETLSRTYVNSAGYVIMLSIAYGKNQSDALQLHKPEVCYPAQGFTLRNKAMATLKLAGGVIPITLLETNLAQRYEPVTYWTVVGDHITTSGTNKKLVEIRYGLRGEIPDGMLVRFSSIDNDTANAYAMQKQFAAQMIEAIAPRIRKRFAGDPSSI